jgi:hypothetical protein
MKNTQKAWFGCTTAKLLEHIETYQGIRHHLISRGCVLPFDWLDSAEQRLRNHPGGERNIKKIYREVIRAITSSDVSIIENTVPNFSVAHQIAFSISQKKPTLVLWQKKDNQSFTDSYLEAVESEYLTIREYSGDGYKKIIDTFLGVSRIEFGQNRYNIVLENKQRYYLDWASDQYKKSRSLLIRNAIDQVSAADAQYRERIADY